MAREKFTSLDSDNAGFIQVDKLQELMQRLDLFADDGYVEIMKSRLDPDSLGREIYVKALFVFQSSLS